MKLPLAFEAAFDTVVPEALKTVWRRYLDERRIMLLEELRAANVDIEEACKRDEVVAMLVKFFQAMVQGPAFRNLKLIAQILAGKSADENSRTDDFIMWADTIGSLTAEEIIFFVRLFDADAQAVEEMRIERSLDSYKHHSRLTTLAKKKLVGSGNICPTNDHFQMLGSSLARTGLVIPVSSGGELTFAVSPRASELMTLVRANEAAEDALQSLKK